MQGINQISKTDRSYLKYLLLFIITFSLLFGNCLSQPITWQRVLDNGYGGISKVQQTSDGGYVAVGSDRLNNEFKIYIVKFDYLGNVLWTYRIGAGEADGYWIEETTDKGFIIGGDVYIGGSRAYIVKTDSTGIVQWEKTFSKGFLDQCHSIKQTSDGGYVLGCRTQLNGLNTNWIIKTDYLGNMEWSKVYDSGTGFHIYNTEIEVSEEGYALLGWINSNPSDVLLIIYNKNGDTIRTKRFGGSGSDVGNSIDLAQNGYVIGGYSSSFDTSKVESYLIRTDSLLNIVWQQTYSGVYGEECNSVKYSPGIGYIMAGYTDTNNFLFARAMIRIVDLSGNVKLQKTYFPANRGGWFNNVELTSDGGYILGGAANNNSFIKMYITKTDSLLEAEPIGIISNGNNLPEGFYISQNYPNPFNPGTNVLMKLDRPAVIRINIYDVTGKFIMEAVNKYFSEGQHKISFMFDLLKVSSGVYFYSVLINNSFQPISIKKMIFLK